MIGLREAIANSRHHGGTPPVVLAAWDLASFGTGLTRSTDKLTVTKTDASASTFASARSVGSCPATANRYFKLTIADPVGASPFMMVGIATTGMPTDGGTAYPGGDTNGYGYYEQDGHRYRNAVSTAYGTSYANGNTILVAKKGSTNQLFFRKGSTWQNSGNPSTGAGAISIVSAVYYAAVGLYAESQGVTADFTSTDPDPLLAGFTPWV